MPASSTPALVMRELTAEDAQAFYALRLSALETNPEAFSSSAEDWRQHLLVEVEKRLRGSQASGDMVILGAFMDSSLVGMMGMRREAYLKLRHKATVWGVYVEPEWRGQGIAGRLLDELIRRAREMPDLEQLLLGVTIQEPAMRLYRSRRFEVYGVEKHALLVDGQFYDAAHMQLFM